MKVKYIGPDIGATCLTNGKIYVVSEIDELTGALRILDDDPVGFDDWDLDCPPGYLYSPTKPKSLYGEYQGGHFEIVEDDEKGSLKKAIYGK